MLITVPNWFQNPLPLHGHELEMRGTLASRRSTDALSSRVMAAEIGCAAPRDKARSDAKQDRHTRRFRLTVKKVSRSFWNVVYFENVLIGTHESAEVAEYERDFRLYCLAARPDRSSPPRIGPDGSVGPAGAAEDVDPL